MEINLPISEENISNVFGRCDENALCLEQKLGITIVNGDGKLLISGADEKNVRKAGKVLEGLFKTAAKGETITVQHVNYLLSLDGDEENRDLKELLSQVVVFTKAGKPVRAKTFGQQQYINAIKNNLLTFAIGPAGTGKTYLAMALAINAFKNGEVNRIILTRPAIEAGERLGFLPGDLQSKIDPYLRPLYDALYEIMGAEAFQRNMEKGAIEVAPLAYMRGRTLDNSFIVLDEAQNTTQAQMKMFLTRMGFGSKMVVTGDLTQIDLPKGEESGLKQAVAFLNEIEGVSICRLTNRDVVRHPLVQEIVAAYEKNEKKQEKDNK